MLSNDLLLEFSRLKFKEQSKRTLQLAFFDYDIVSFLNNNQIELPPTESITVFCALGLIKFAIERDAHTLDGQTLSATIGNFNLKNNLSAIKFEQWLNSDSIFNFYEYSIEILKFLKVKKLKINALTLYESVYLKQQMLNGLVNPNTPIFDRFPIREAMNYHKYFPHLEQSVIPERIISSRNTVNLTQKECADLVYVDERTWQRWESGERKMGKNIYELFLIKTGLSR